MVVRSLVFVSSLVVAGVAAGETVSAVSAPFSFPSSTSVAPQAHRFAEPLTCRVRADGVEFRYGLAAGSSHGVLRVADLAGRSLLSMRVTGDGPVVWTRPTGSAPGVYVVRLEIAGTSQSVRLVLP